MFVSVCWACFFTVVWAYLAEQGNRIVYSVWHITKNSSELSRMPVETWEARAVLYFSSDFPHTCDHTKLWFSCVPSHKERIYWHWTTEYSLSEHHLVLNNPSGVSETTSLPLLAWHSTQTLCTELSSAQLSSAALSAPAQAALLGLSGAASMHPTWFIRSLL